MPQKVWKINLENGHPQSRKDELLGPNEGDRVK